MQEKLRLAHGRAIAAAVAVGCGSAHGLTLGELQVDSALGEPLEARILVTRSPGEPLEGRCFSSLPAGLDGIPDVDGVRLTLHRSATSAELQARTFRPVADPALALRIRIACPGQEAGSTTRDYMVLLEPRGTAAPGGAPLVTSLPVRAGDTFESIAQAMVPGRAARRQYLAALRAANPAHAQRGDREALPVDAAIALPDPRGLGKVRTPPPSAVEPARPRATPEVAAAPAVAKAPAEPAPARAERPAARPAPVAPKAPVREPAPPAKSAKAPARGDFVLKLSGSEIDLSRSSRIDDRMRQQLRERQLLLDSDDQVAALLAMRNSLKLLENRVAELQLKLSGIPAAGAQPAADVPPVKAPAPASVAPPPVPTPVPVPAAEPKVVEAKAAESKAPEATAPEAKAPEAKPAGQAPPPAPVATPVKAPPKAVPPPAESSWIASTWAWAAGALLVLLAGAVVLLRLRRREADPARDWARDGGGASAPAGYVEPAHDATVVMEAPPEFTATVAQPTAVVAEEAQPQDDSRALRRRYIEERFPEILNGTLELDDADSVIKSARLFYEDGALPRAVELLQFAIEDRPGEVRTWLALFEIFRLERLAGQYGELAARFQSEHGETDAWRKVRYFGREIDPGNELYREEALAHLETIGPREARRIAAANEPVDPIAENWLNAPMDFQNEVLANELRVTLMAEASLDDHQLSPNPMSALRNIEMFTVA